MIYIHLETITSLMLELHFAVSSSLNVILGVWYITVVTLFTESTSFRDQLLPRLPLSILSDRQWFTIGSEVVQWSLSGIMHRSFSSEGRLAHRIDIFAWVACVSESIMLINTINNTHCWSTVGGRLKGAKFKSVVCAVHCIFPPWILLRIPFSVNYHHH